MKAKAAIAQILKDEGVEFLSCFPSNPMIDACAEIGIRPVIARTERVVVNIADGFSRVAGNGRIGVCAMQEGAGVENAFAGVAQAYGDSVPVLVLPAFWGHDQTDVSHFNAVATFGRAGRSGRARRQLRLPRARHMRRAFTAPRTGRPGRVMLEVPKDVAEQELTKEFTYTPVTRHRTRPRSGRRLQGDLHVRAARRPLLLAGQGHPPGRGMDRAARAGRGPGHPGRHDDGGQQASRRPIRSPLGVAGLDDDEAGRTSSCRTAPTCILAVGASMTKWRDVPPDPEGLRDDPVHHRGA